MAYFNPRAPCGARRDSIGVEVKKDEFQSTRPVWGATTKGYVYLTISGLFQSTRPVWGATASALWVAVSVDISIHAPRVGRDDFGRRQTTQLHLFQSTRPVWGATTAKSAKIFLSCYFNPRAPCGARLSAWHRCRPDDDFNPRAPCGARPPLVRFTHTQRHFNPRAPCGARRGVFK